MKMILEGGNNVSTKHVECSCCTNCTDYSEENVSLTLKIWWEMFGNLLLVHVHASTCDI
uniref:Uncharacterized protein n=1 Tax=Anguilla anguilla TaxID=7936 RepID=A0A0E9V1C2_ANGAN